MTGGERRTGRRSRAAAVAAAVGLLVGLLVHLPATSQVPSQPPAAEPPPVHWISHLDLRGDDTVSTTCCLGPEGGPDDGLEVRSSSPGDEWLEKGVPVPPGYLIEGVRLCYDLGPATSATVISQVRLDQLDDPPERALVRHDDGTDISATGRPECRDSASLPVDPAQGAVRLSLRVAFGAQLEPVVLLGLGLRLRPPATPQSGRMWINHLDLLPGDPSVVTSFDPVSSGVGGGLSGLVIGSTTQGGVSSVDDFKVVTKGVEVPPGYLVEDVRVCYEVGASGPPTTTTTVPRPTGINRIILSQQPQDAPGTSEPVLTDFASRILDDPGPACADSQSAEVDPARGALALAIGVTFGDTADRIVLRGVALRLRPAGRLAPRMWLNHLGLALQQPGPLVSSVSPYRRSQPGVLAVQPQPVLLTAAAVAETSGRLHKALEVPPGYWVRRIHLCYQLAGGAMIGQVRVAQLEDPPSSTAVALDDETDLTGAGLVCAESPAGGGVWAAFPFLGSLRLSIRPEFSPAEGSVTLYSVALDLVAVTTLDLASAPRPSRYGEPAAFTATVTSQAPVPAPGSVDFELADGTPLGQARLGPDGRAQLVTATLAPGFYSVFAYYRPGDDSPFAASLGGLQHGVERAPTETQLVSSPGTSSFGQPVTFTVSVSAPALEAGAQGTVLVHDLGRPLGVVTLDEDGVGRLTTAELAVGPHRITAEYSGSELFEPSRASISHTVRQASTTMALVASSEPSAFGQPVTFTATVRPAPPDARNPPLTGNGRSAAAAAPPPPTGTVTFGDGGRVLAAAPLAADGSASFTTAELAVGRHALTASYGGDASFGPATASVVHTVRAATTTVALSATPSPSAFGQSVTFTATVTAAGPGVPRGAVTFGDGAAVLATAPVGSDGRARITVATLGVGAHVITAAYGGDGSFAPSSASSTHQVVAAATTMVLTSSANPSPFGEAVTLVAVVSSPGAGPVPGSVTFTDAGVVVASVALDADGLARLALPALAVGTHELAASYAGSPSFGPSTAGLRQTVTAAATTTALTAGPAPPRFGEPVTLTALVASTGPAPVTGTVTFLDGEAVVGTAPVGPGGVARLVVPSLDAGPHALGARFGGSPTLAASTGALPLVVLPAVTTTSAAGSPDPAIQGEQVTLTAAVDSAAPRAPTGTVTFSVAGAILGQAPVGAGGRAALVTGAPVAGTHAVEVAYSGDASFEPSATTVVLTVLPPAVVALSPNVGAPGTVALVSAEGFRPGAVVQLAWALGEDPTPRLPVATVTADGQGRFGPVPVIVSRGDDLGPRTLVATAQRGTATASFLVVRSTARPSAGGMSVTGAALVLRRR